MDDHVPFPLAIVTAALRQARLLENIATLAQP